MDLNDLMSDLDSGNTTINNEEEARELTQNLVDTLAQLILSSKETSHPTTEGTFIQPTTKTDIKEEEGETAKDLTLPQDVTPTPTKAKISPEQIKHATVSWVLNF